MKSVWTKGAELPAPPATKQLKCIWPKPGRDVDATIVGEQIYAYLMHWIPPSEESPKGRSSLHTEPARSCYGCKIRMRTQWTGYLAVYSHRDCGFRCLILSPTSAHAIIGAVGKRSSIRGMRVLLARATNSRTARVQSLYTDAPPLNPLPAHLDLYPTLSNIYGPELPPLDRYTEPDLSAFNGGEEQ